MYIYLYYSRTKQATITTVSKCSEKSHRNTAGKVVKTIILSYFMGNEK